MPSVNPSPEQLAAYVAAMPAGMPILMLNLLRYNAQATYPAGCQHSPCSGREAYARYSRVALAKVQACGGAVEVRAKAHAALIAPAEEQWDDLLLVSYPSKEAFLAMISDHEYQAATEHRSAALADSRLIGTTRY
ncbi:DUF1330 domain-containing protein [Stutzerimonas frequens]